MLDNFEPSLTLFELSPFKISEPEVHDRRLALLNWASQVINSACLDPTGLYEAIHQAVIWLIPADMYTISLIDEPHQNVQEISFVEGNREPILRRSSNVQAFVRFMQTHERSAQIVNHLDIAPFPKHFDPFTGMGNKFGSGLTVILKRGDVPFGVFSIASYLRDSFSENDSLILNLFAAHVSIALENARLHNHLQKATINAERQRIARDLHDSVTQLIYSFTLLSSGWRMMADNHRLDNPADSFKQLEELGLSTLKEMRLLIHQLRPSILQEKGLVKALQIRLETVERRVKLNTQLLVDGELPPFSQQVENELYNIAQEALNNALRHSNASNIVVRLNSNRNRISLSICDDGIGFKQPVPTGIGLKSMHERAELIGAKLIVDSKTHLGTTVSVTADFSKNNDC